MSCRPRIGWFEDGGIARRRKLVLGTEFERRAMGQEDLFVGPPIENCGEFAAASLQVESYLEREHNARWAALSVAQATSGITAIVSSYFCPTHPRVRAAQSLPTRRVGQRGGTIAIVCR
jgi:hypothetical protein